MTYQRIGSGKGLRLLRNRRGGGRTLVGGGAGGVGSVLDSWRKIFE